MPQMDAEIRRFLDDAFHTRLIDETVYYRLVFELQHRSDERTAAAHAERASVWATTALPAPPTRAAAPDTQTSAERSVTRPTETAASTQPGWWNEPEPPVSRALWAGWVGAVRELLASELALHGLAYLGVVLTFIGAFGFVVFAYGELDRSLRPVAEAVIPLVCFLTAWFLRSQRAPHVAAGLEFLGGLLLPLVAYASFVDDGTVPPDLVGAPLVAALALVSLALCGAYAIWTAKHPASPLRYLAAPMAWQVVWALGLVFADERVAGVAIRRPNQWQMTAYVLAVVASIALARWFPRRQLASETRIAAIVGLALGYALMLASGFAQGWEPAPVALTGLAVVVGIDILATGASDRTGGGARLAQSFVVAFTVAALLPDLELGWAGFAATIAAIALLERWARGTSTAPERAVAVAELGAGLAMATTEPWAAVAAFGLASVWAHVRRILGLPALRVPARAGRGEVKLVDAELTWMDAAAALLPVGVAYGLWQELGPETALMVSSALLLAAALAYLLAGIDRIASLWLVVSAVSLGLLTIGPWDREGATGSLFVSAGLCSAVIALAAASTVIRIWLGAAGIAWTAFLGMELGGLTLEQRTLGWAGAGLLLVVVAAVAVPSVPREHLIAVGQLSSAGALGSVLWLAGGVRLASLGAWTLGWVVEIVSGEVRGRSENAAGRAFGVLAPILVALSMPVLVLDAARFGGLLEGRPGLAGVLLAALALLEAAIARPIERRRPLSELVVAGAFGTSIVAIGAAVGEPWPAIVACAGLIGVVITIPAPLRIAPMVWAAWLASSAIAVLLAERAGLPNDRLFVAGFMWSALVLLGGLALDQLLAGRRVRGDLIRTRWLVPTLTLGGAGLLVSLGFSLVEPSAVYGWWMLVGGAVYLGAAILLRAGSVSFLAWGLGAFGVGSLLSERVLDDPALLVVGAVVPLVAASMLARATKQGEPWPFRWDLPPFVVAHAMVVFALGRAARIDELAPAWLGAAAVSLAVAAYLRRWPWALAGGVLAAVGAWDLGPGWLAAVLAADSAGVGIAASRSEGDRRLPLQMVCGALAAAAWIQTATAIGWSPEETLRATALVAGGQLLLACSAVRLRLLAPDWIVLAAALAFAGIGAVEYAALPAGVLAGDPAAHRALATAFMMAAVATGISAAPSGLPRLRELSGVLGAAALGEVLLWMEASPGAAVAVLVTSGVGSMLLALILWRTGVWRSSAPAIGTFSALISAASLFVALQALPDRSPLVAALLVCGIESAAAGLVLRRAEPLVLSPLLLSGAWIVFTREAFAGDPQWFTVPLGLAVFAVVEVLRWDLRRRGRPVNTPELVALEVAGFAFLIGASPVRVIQGSSWAGAVGVALGVLVAGWGALTRVRRRLWFGLAAAAGSLLLMVIVPLAQDPPKVASATLWVLLAAAGVAVVLLATALERWRSYIGQRMHRLGALIRDWD
ncbi:MAG: hypothetical protein L0206_12735 [Actinobacteria bacterium]|nr:hypothetical protein [Actinomycetota bacterium]